MRESLGSLKAYEMKYAVYWDKKETEMFDNINS